MPKRLRLLVPLLTVVLLAACGGEEDDATERRPATLYGRLTDAETGAPVLRDTLLMHFNCDDLAFRDTLMPRDMTEYRIAMPDRKIRVRVLDSSGRYEPYEHVVTVAGEEQALDIALTPTHNVLLLVRLVDGISGRQPIDMRIAGEWTGLRLTLSDEQGQVHDGHLVLDDFGAVEVRVPRTKLRIAVTNVSTVPEQPVIDLSHYEGARHEVVVRMVEPPK